MGRIWRVSGPLVIADDMKGTQVYEVVEIGEQGIVGEVIGLEGNKAVIQAHEDTLGLRTGEDVKGTGKTLSVELGPGLMGAIYDGLQKSLLALAENTGSFIKRGAKAVALPRDKKWQFTPKVQAGDKISEGDIIGTVPETELVEHRIMVPIGVNGTVKEIREGDYSVEETIARVEHDGKIRELTLMQEWPVRKPRPYKDRFDPSGLLTTGMRILDYMFPLALGGKASIPGGFGTGKTVALQQLVRWAQTDLNIYVGCGERGNEMADVLYSFRKLKEPKTGRLLLEKEIFLANTSNMPVVAREASIFVGVTMAEYFRDMGYDVLLVADSTSRWAEAMREMGGRLEEMPGEEGFPSYMGSRLSSFYERAGMVGCLGNPTRRGSVTVAGAVSPPGADFSEPVTQNTLRIVDALYALDVSLANKRHFPAISWLTSYSLYVDAVRDWWNEFDPAWEETRARALKILQQEAELEEIVRLVGPEALPEEDKLLLLTSRMIREDFLQQSAYHEVDTYCTPGKAGLMLRTITKFYDLSREMLNSGAGIESIRSSPMVYKISRMKDIPNEDFAQTAGELWSEMEGSLVARKRVA
ncbi:MAG: V-type ATP synthase subunit A [Chloroflexi bacterium]|nr:V-type ATP synthase subunit A [Chloroflexota bacterium]MCK4262828.1 V-type ATP synthase subunit A [Dehalococcoidia bacterium]